MLDFIKKPFQKLKTTYEQLDQPAKKLFTAFAQFLLVLIPTAWTAYANKTADKAWGVVAYDVIEKMGGGYLIAQIMGPNINNLLAATRPYLPNFIVSQNLTNEMRRIEKQYKDQELSMTDKQKKSMLYGLKFFKVLCNRSLAASDSDYDRALAVRYLALVDFSLKILLTNNIAAMLENSTQAKNNLLIKIDRLLSTYGNKALIKQEIIKPFLGNAYSGSKLPARSIYLVGDPGVGKTKFVTELASILDCVCIKVDYSTVTNSQAFDIFKDFDIKSIHLITQARLAMHEAGKSLCIIFFDELDKNLSADTENKNTSYTNDSSIQTFLLKMLNPDLDMVLDSYLNLEVPTVNILLVAAGNKMLTDIGGDYSALASRFIPIEFPKLEPQLKTEIAVTYVKQKFIQANLEITETDVNAIEKMATEDTNPGVRILKMAVETYVGNKLAASVFAGTAWDTDLNPSVAAETIAARPVSVLFSGTPKNTAESLTDDAREFEEYCTEINRYFCKI